MSEDLPFPEDDSNNSVLKIQNMLGDNVTKMKIKYVADELSRGLAEAGDTDLLRYYIKIKAMKEVLTEIESRLKPHATEEANKYGREGGKIMGIKFENSTSATKYSYEHDLEWKELKAILEDTKAIMKKREDLMKQAIKFTGVFDDDGVEIEQAKVVGGGGSIVKVTIPSE